jgi:hypothetical protein
MGSFRPALRPGALAAGLVLLLGAPAVAQSNILLQLESGSPAGDRFVVDSAGGFVARGTSGSGSIPATGGGTRLMWFPAKAAFRAGFVTGVGDAWSLPNIGTWSMALGYDAVASGNDAVSLGDRNHASGSASTAMGRTTLASGSNATAMGLGTIAEGDHSTAMGWATTASGGASTAMGYSTTAGGSYSTAMGRATTAGGITSTAMGEGTRASGANSTAMGRRAATAYFGSFVYGDGTTGDTVRASAAHQATWRTTGGFRIFTNTALSNGCSIAGGGTAWSCTSSRLEKENFEEVDGEEVLRRLRAVPVTSWNGIAEGPQVRHIGPMAQDWHAAFGLNDDPLTIHQGDLAGVSLAAVQALMARTDALREENAALRAATLTADGRTERQEERIRAVEAENAALRADASEQRARLERLEALLAGPVPEP